VFTTHRKRKAKLVNFIKSESVETILGFQPLVPAGTSLTVRVPLLFFRLLKQE